MGVLAICIVMLMITGNCAYQSYTGPGGDELGYGRMGVIESGILILTILWLAAGLSLRSHAERRRKFEAVRGTLGLALGGFSAVIAVAHEIAAPTQMESMMSVMLFATGLCLIVQGVRTLARE